MADNDPLADWLTAAPPILLGYSGGVDSAVLAVAGTRVIAPGRFLAVLGVSPSVPAQQVEQAREVARAHRVPLIEIDTRELADPSYRANGTDRCYFCKRELWSAVGRIAAERGLSTMIDGTHHDDVGEHRPGGRAADERGVRSPFVELGWGKAEVRAEARRLGLSIADVPAAPCLASRVRYGLEVTPARLGQVERAEAFLRSLGVVGDLRVRHWGDRARIEVNPAMFALIDRWWPAVERELKTLGFDAVERDPRGYRRGSLLPVAS